jgi:geranylgeranyl diphosphate synthase type I
MTATIPSTLDTTRAFVEPALRAAVARLDPWSHHVTAYHLGWCDEDGRPTTGASGKAVRPAMALLAAQAAGGLAGSAVPGAVAVELVHNFSLLHDDLLDRDEKRRHRRTVWAVWGEATAILTGDALLALAHEVLLEAPSPEAARAAWLLASATRELARGQIADLAFETRGDVGLEECLDMAAAKTASLLATSAGIGAVLAGGSNSTVDALLRFGREFGLAFQLVDDVLGVWGDPAVTGKPVHSDLRSRKKSLPVTYVAGRPDCPPGLTAWLAGTGEPAPESLPVIADLLDGAGARAWALAEAERRMELAEQALTQVDLEPHARAELLALAHYVVERDR